MEGDEGVWLVVRLVREDGRHKVGLRHPSRSKPMMAFAAERSRIENIKVVL